MKRLFELQALRRLHAVDWVLIAATFAFCSLTVMYPFGRDQGLYHYVGREWFAGALPYRDTMDQKTPLIYLLYGFACWLFDENMWSIRLVELIWVMSIGSHLARAASLRGEEPLPGVLGTATLASAIMYYGVLGFWDTAQCEIWYVGLTYLSLAVVQRHRRAVLGPLMAGFWGGLACLAKPPGVFMVMIPVVALGYNALSESRAQATAVRVRRVLQALLLFTAGAALPTLIVLAYFGARGGLDDLIDVVIKCNAYYREHEFADYGGLPIAVEGVRAAWLFTYPLSLFGFLAGAAGVAIALKKRNWKLLRRYALAFSFPAAAITAVVVQRMYFPYHWGALHVAWAVPLVFAAQDAARVGPTLLVKPVSGAWFGGAFGVLFAIGYTSASGHASAHYGNMKLNYDYLVGKVDSMAWATHYNIPNFYDLASNLAVGEWLRKNSMPHERVASRNFEPAIYAISHRTSGLRFFWTSWLTVPKRSYRREEWLAQDMEQLRRRPPRFAVVFRGSAGSPDSAEYLAPLGEWVERFSYANLTVIERKRPE